MMHIAFQLSKGKRPWNFNQKSWKKQSGELQHSQKNKQNLPKEGAKQNFVFQPPSASGTHR